MAAIAATALRLRVVAEYPYEDEGARVSFAEGDLVGTHEESGHLAVMGGLHLQMSDVTISVKGSDVVAGAVAFSYVSAVT